MLTSDYSRGFGVGISNELHSIFTQQRERFDNCAMQLSNSSIHYLSHGDTIFSRLEHQKTVDLLIIDLKMDDTLFKDLGYAKQDLKNAYCLAHDIYSNLIEDECKSIRITGEEKLAQFKVNNTFCKSLTFFST